MNKFEMPEMVSPTLETDEIECLYKSIETVVSIEALTLFELCM